MHNSSMNFAAPPRRVPLSLRIVNFFNGAAQLGWGIFGFGMIFFWTFGGHADYSFLTFRDPDGRATGRVTRVEDTRASEDDVRVQASHYQFSVAGRTFDGVSYITGAAPAPGTEVEIEYDEENPLRSRIAGMRRAIFGPWAIAVAGVFPLVGFVILYFGTKAGIRRNHLLREGWFTHGKLVGKEPTNMTVNKRPVWALTFEFIDRRGQRQNLVTRTSLTEKLEDEATEPLLYDPEQPQRAYLLDEVPSRPQVEMNGDLAGRPVAAILALILPAIVIAAHALYLLR